ncbi:MAG: NAD-binding protein [Sulfurovum sp.]|nr:NAD-binding protein [Sulfurovum sp.]
MAAKRILIFGYGSHGRFIAKGLLEDGYALQIVEADEKHHKIALNDGFSESVLIDIGSDEALEALNPQSFDKIVCVMNDEHLNVFITLSLTSLFKDLNIVAISDSIHTTSKLKMAGAQKVIDLYEVSANRILNILNRPIATELLKDFVMSKTGISFMEMEIPEGSFLHGKKIEEVDFSCYNVLLVGMVDMERGRGFEFVTAGQEHWLDTGDIIVCMGEVTKLHTFKKIIARKDVNQCHKIKESKV